VSVLSEQTHFDQARPLLKAHLQPNAHVIMDKGYDRDAIRAYVNQLGATAVIALHPSRSQKPAFDEHLYRECHRIENFFARLDIGYHAGTELNPHAGIRNYNGTTILTLLNTGNVGIGTTNPTHKLAVNGTIKAKEVIVETAGWSDYVFADYYVLAPLAEVEAHIKEHKHLPGIPSAAQVAEGGVSIGDMQARLLAKIEELTLHAIEQGKHLDEAAALIAKQAER
jgi:transposase